jgi:hypothetical protein
MLEQNKVRSCIRVGFLSKDRTKNGIRKISPQYDFNFYYHKLNKAQLKRCGVKIGQVSAFDEPLSICSSTMQIRDIIIFRKIVGRVLSY